MAMEITPSAKSAFLAGFTMSLVAWLSLFKLDKIPIINRFMRRDRILDWMTENKALSLIATEVVNFGVHGITNPTATTFAIGSTVTNSLMIFLYLPFRSWKRTGEERAVLQQRR